MATGYCSHLFEEFSRSDAAADADVALTPVSGRERVVALLGDLVRLDCAAVDAFRALTDETPSPMASAGGDRASPAAAAPRRLAN